MSTEAQKWAQKRNIRKFRLLGVMAHLFPEPNIVTPDEKARLENARLLVKEVLREWDDNNAESKEIYLSGTRNT